MILRRALAREVLLTSFAVTAVIFCIFVVVRVLGFLRQAAEGIIPVDSIFVLLFLKVIAYMDVILPLMMFVAMLLVLWRHRSNIQRLINGTEPKVGQKD